MNAMNKIILFGTLLLSLLTHTSIHAIEKSKISFEGSPNNTDVGVLPAGGVLSVPTGVKTIIYGARAERCGQEAPTFEDAMKNMDETPVGIGEFYDAGIGVRMSKSCGGAVKSRAIGVKLNPDFKGELVISFYRIDKITIKVK